MFIKLSRSERLKKEADNSSITLSFLREFIDKVHLGLWQGGMDIICCMAGAKELCRTEQDGWGTDARTTPGKVKMLCVLAKGRARACSRNKPQWDVGDGSI